MRRSLVLLALMWVWAVHAQNNASTLEVRRIEGEIGVGLVFATGKLQFDRNNTGATCHAELRYNLQRQPIDVGVQVSGTTFHRESDMAGLKNFHSWNLLAVADYNYRRGRRVSLFGGLGVGYASIESSAPIMFDNTQPNWGGFSDGGQRGSFCVMPRIGVEFFNHLRLTLDYKWQEKANRHFSLTLGGVFGGGRKK